MKRILIVLFLMTLILSLAGCQPQQNIELKDTTSMIASEASNYKFHGKYQLTQGGVICDETATGISFSGYFQGAITVDMIISADTYFTVFIDGQRSEERIAVDMYNEEPVKIAEFSEAGQHTVELIKQSEACKSLCLLKSVSFTGYLTTPPADKEYCIAFIGDSITAGYGVYYPIGDAEAGSTICEDGTMTYAYLAAQALNADPIVICRSGIGISAGHTGYMMDSYFAAQNFCREDKSRYTPPRKPDLVVVNLGTNDAMGSDEKLASKLPGFINIIRNIYGSDVPIVWVHGMMNDARWPAMNKVLQEQYGGESGGCYGLLMPETRDGGNNHPSLTAHSNAADLLVQFITEKELLN